MKVLFDHNMPDQLAHLLIAYEVILTRHMGWEELRNGRLLKAAEMAGILVMVTGDKGIVRQQNNFRRRIALVVVGNTDRVVVSAHSEAVMAALARVSEGSYELVPMPGTRDFLKALARRER